MPFPTIFDFLFFLYFLLFWFPTSSNSLWWHFSFGDISVLVTFQLWWHWWHFSLNDISVLVSFQFWWQFSFGDISVLVTFQSWWHFSFGDISYYFWFPTFWFPTFLISCFSDFLLIPIPYIFRFPTFFDFLLFSCTEQLYMSSCRSVGRSVRWYTFVKEWPLEYQMVT